MALTFDDGPSAWSGPIAELLAEHGAHATFFVIGSLVEQHAELVERLASAGHEIGNHTWSHPWLARDCDDARVRDELERTNERLADLLGAPPRRFRAPHYDVDDRVEAIAAEVGLVHTRGDVTPPDWTPAARAPFIATLVVQLVTPDAVVGLHDGIPPHGSSARTSRQPTVDAVAAMLPLLRDRGFELVTASDLLG